MADYVICETTSTSVTVKIFDASTTKTYYRIYVRTNEEGSAAIYDEVHSCSGSHSYTFTISGLTRNTEYLLNIGPSDSTGDNWDKLDTAFTFITTSFNAPTISSITTSGFKVTVKWKNKTGVKAGYLILLDGKSVAEGSLSTTGTTTRTTSFVVDETEFDYNESYTLDLITLYDDPYQASYVSEEITFTPFKVQITDWVANGNQVTIEWEVTSGELDSYYFEVNGVEKTEETIEESGGFYYSTLSFNNFETSYTVYLYAIGTDGSESSDSVTVTTEALEKWYWDNYNSTTGWYEDDALSGKGPFSTITAARWKEFVAFFNGLTSASQAVGLSNNIYIVQEIDDEILTAVNFWGLIAQSNSTFIDAGFPNFYTAPDETDIQTGLPVYGYYITDLTTAYNKLVDKINNA